MLLLRNVDNMTLFLSRTLNSPTLSQRAGLCIAQLARCNRIDIDIDIIEHLTIIP